MNSDTFVFMVPIALFAMIFFIVKSVVENKTRQKAIEKGVSDDALKNLFAHPVQTGQGTGELKWGMVAIAIGLSLAAVEFMGLEPDQPLAFGIPLIFAGAALIAYQILRPHFASKA
jgi:hypothetical protein